MTLLRKNQSGANERMTGKPATATSSNGGGGAHGIRDGAGPRRIPRRIDGGPPRRCGAPAATGQRRDRLLDAWPCIRRRGDEAGDVRSSRVVAATAGYAGHRSSGPRQPPVHLARQVEHDVRRRLQHWRRHARPCTEGAAVPTARGLALPRGEGAMRIPPSLRRETVVVRRYRGQGAYGPIYGDP